MRAIVGIIGCVAAFCITACERTQAQTSSALRQIAAIRLPDVKGRIDHLAFDPSTQRLWVAALGNNTVEVLDTDKPAHRRSLSGFHEPQGMASSLISAVLPLPRSEDCSWSIRRRERRSDKCRLTDIPNHFNSKRQGRECSQIFPVYSSRKSSQRIANQ
jgi:hypothetical protein